MSGINLPPQIYHRTLLAFCCTYTELYYLKHIAVCALKGNVMDVAWGTWIKHVGCRILTVAGELCWWIVTLTSRLLSSCPSCRSRHWNSLSRSCLCVVLCSPMYWFLLLWCVSVKTAKHRVEYNQPMHFLMCSFYHQVAIYILVITCVAVVLKIWALMCWASTQKTPSLSGRFTNMRPTAPPCLVLINGLS